MLPATEEEKLDVIGYYLSQSPDAEVTFLQKIYSEAIMGHRHDVWDVHASDGRWWVITNPTNLYSQAQFPNMDLAVTFHMGLCLRIPRTQQRRRSKRNIKPFEEVFSKLREASDALGQAQNVADYQAMGMRSREALLRFRRRGSGRANGPPKRAPQRANFRGWSDLICDKALGGGAQRDRRRLLKNLLAEAWVFTNWLTHAQSATWHDAEAAHTTTEHVIGLAASLVIRHIRSVPEQCPNCGSSHLSPQEGWHEEMPEVLWERPVCDDCGWTGKPVPVEVDEENGDGLISRIGGDDHNECVTPEVPFAKLSRPGDA